nr:phospholipase-like protein [Tanacetum cinerariifolium]
MWAKFYERSVNIVDEHRQQHLDQKKKNPNYNATYNLCGFAWAFKESYEDESILVSKDNSVDEDCNVCEDASASLSKDEIVNDKLVDEDCNVCEDASAGLSKHNVMNEKSFGNNDEILLEDGDGLFDSKAGCRNNEEDNKNQQAKRLLKEKLPNDYAAENTKPNMIPNHSYDIPSCFVSDLNSNQTGVYQELGGAANDPMSICSRPDMHNAEVGCDGMAIDKPDQMNDYNCSQPIPASVDALIQACAYATDHPELDVLQHEAHVDRYGPKINQHPMAKPLSADEFRDDYMSILNDEEMIFIVSLDDMKFQHEEENSPVKNTPLEHQPIDELIDAQIDTMNLLPENIKDEINKSKSIQERKKRLAMALGSPHGQLGTTTLAPPKTRSMTSIGDTIMAPEFEVEISGPLKIRSLNKLMTLQVFIEV